MNKRKLVTDRRPGWQGPYGAVDMNEKNIDVSIEEKLANIEKLVEKILAKIDQMPSIKPGAGQ